MNRESSRFAKWRLEAERLHIEAHVFYFAFRHPRTPWYARVIAVCTAGYLLSPIQLIPNFIPVIGFLDDFFVLFLGAKLLERIIPPQALAECRRLAEAAGQRRREAITSVAAVVGFGVIVFLWLLGGGIVSALMMRFVRH